jgi:hypothetical protein
MPTPARGRPLQPKGRHMDLTMVVDLNGDPLDPNGWQTALDLASDQGERVWVVNEQGKRLAALVPVDEAEESVRRHEEFMASMRSLVPARKDRRTGDQAEKGAGG